jgi:ABC-type glycerol-3-phosphate transport system permease component
MAIKAEVTPTDYDKELARSHRRQLVRDRLNKAGIYFVLILAAMVLGLPFLWMVTTSLKTPQEIAIYPPQLLPEKLRWENFSTAWSVAPFDIFYFNSIFTGVTSTLLQVTFALLMAYALIFVEFPFKRLLFLLILATMMIPVEMKLVPNFILLKKLGDISRLADVPTQAALAAIGLKIAPAQICCGINSYFALIVPPAAHAFPVFVLHQQFRTLPRDLIDAARVDGASHLQILWRVVTPLSRPVLAATILIAFVGRWNDYLWPLVITQSEAMRTLPVGLAFLRAASAEGSTPWNLLMAASIFVILPILVLFLFTQKQFVAGLTTGAIKG